MTRSAIQLYTLRDVDRPFTELLERVADAGFAGVEFAYRVTEEDPEAVRNTLDGVGLDAAGAHVHVEDLEDDFEETVAFYEGLGVENVVVPYLPAESFETLEAAEATAERLDRLADRLEDRGMELHYHNHDHEFASLGGESATAETGFDAFLAHSDVWVELDLGLAMAAGDDVVARLRSLGERSRLVHLKDYDVAAGESVPVGEGDLDLAGIGEAVAGNDSEWLVYEYEGSDPLATLGRSARRTNDLCE